MSSTVASSPTAQFSESDDDMNVDMDTRGSTVVPSSPSSTHEYSSHPIKKTEVVERRAEVDHDAFTELLDASKNGGKGEEDLQARMARLDMLLSKSSAYSQILGERMKKVQLDYKTVEGTSTASAPPKGKGNFKRGRGRKSEPSKVGAGSKRGRRVLEEDAGGESGTSAKRVKLDDDQEDESMFKQADAITGAKLKDYQLQGVAWLASLWENGMNGILADEMGLGKTLQTIAFLAHMRQRGTSKPALIICPLSVLHNWVDEFEKFAPSIPICMYHGTPEDRAELRRTRMKNVDEESTSSKTGASPAKRLATTARTPSKKTSKSKIATQGSKSKRPPKGKTGATNESARKSTRRTSRNRVEVPIRRSGRHRHDADVQVADDKDHEAESEDEDEESGSQSDETGSHSESETDTQDADNTTAEVTQDEVDGDKKRAQDAFPIVLTTYEMIIKDRQHLSKYKWNFIVVDEGHRLKNMDCKLVQEIKKYDSANRLILTGTPLHNNLAELWSLLNFILPDLFQDLDSFQEWFNLPSLQSTFPNDQSNNVISKLHGILKPFLLRRLKADVEHSLPPKKEYVLYAPLSERQRGVYDAVLNGALRRYLINGKQNGKAKEERIPQDEGRRTRKRRKINYKVDGDDDEWFERLEEGDLVRQTAPQDEVDAGRQFHYKNTIKQVNSMKLQNTVMQLRKVCSHPFLFDWPSDPITREPVVNEQLVNASGKMMILERLLDELFKRGHKVLLFSQFTTCLDIIEEWADSFKSWPTCRIDGSTGPLERRAEMYRFQDGGDDPEAPRLFLLSTRAGGLGINLTAADTVIFYDQDWNPQMDVQAQDRAHRIGQTKPVLIFRLVSAHTVETKIMQKANEKRKLEALVIAKGKFRMPGSTSRGKGDTVANMAAELLKLDGEKIEVVSEAGKAKVISDADLDKLLDRSPEVFADRGQGWKSGAKAKVEEGEQIEGDVAFEVFQAPVDQCNDGLAAMMGEQLE